MTLITKITICIEFVFSERTIKTKAVSRKIQDAAFIFFRLTIAYATRFLSVILNYFKPNNCFLVGEHQHSPCNIFRNKYLLINDYKV